MKKALFLSLALTLAFSLTACGEKNETEPKKDETIIENQVENNNEASEESDYDITDPFADLSVEYLASEEGMIYQQLYHYYRASSEWIEEDSDFEVKNVENQRIKIFTPEEIAASSELFESHNLQSGDIAFEATVDLVVSEKAQDLLKYTAGTGEIDGNKIKNKYQCGIARKVEDGYEFEFLGTSF